MSARPLVSIVALGLLLGASACTSAKHSAAPASHLPSVLTPTSPLASKLNPSPAVGAAGAVGSSPVGAVPATPASSRPIVPGYVVPAVSSLHDNPTKHKAVTLSGCAASEGRWAARGKVVNPNPVATSYTITVFYTDNTDTVVDYASSTVTVAAEKSEQWMTFGQHPDTGPLTCTVKGVS
jgi:hypothetical protein